jgi:plasmid maintenance system antidote protein VapI
MAKKTARVSEQLRRALMNCGESRYQVSKMTGIQQSVLSRFVNGRHGLTLDTLDRLADYLELELKKKT